MSDIDKLKEAVWLTWLRGVGSGMSYGPADMLKQYGFTGPFAGLDKHFDKPEEIAWALEQLREEICFDCGHCYGEHRPGMLGGVDCPPIS